MVRKPEVLRSQPDPRVIHFPAPVPMRTSLLPSDFHFLLFSIYYPSVPSLVVTPVSCTLGLPCSVPVPFVVPSDLAHVLCLSQTIRIQCHVCSHSLNIKSAYVLYS